MITVSEFSNQSIIAQLNIIGFMDSTTAPLFEHLNVLEHMDLFAKLRYVSEGYGICGYCGILYFEVDTVAYCTLSID